MSSARLLLAQHMAGCCACIDGLESMEDKNKFSLKVPAELYYTDKGALSISIKLLTNDGSVLNSIVKDKVIDHNRSFFDMFVKPDVDTLWQTLILFSGMFSFVNEGEQTLSPDEKIDKRIIELMAEHIHQSIGCEYCVRQHICKPQMEKYSSIGIDWLERPSNDICIQNIIRYFYKQAYKAK